MLTLRLTQHLGTQPGEYRVEVALEGDGLARQTADVPVRFSLSQEDQADLRWYLEDYLQYPQEPAPAIAARVEGRMAEIGVELFRAVFQADDDARDLWAGLRTRLNEARVEVVTGVAGATAIPWELIRDPKTDTPLALRARAFVRAQPRAAQPPALPPVPQAGAEPIRILLVICRPRAGEDVPFRSVASRILKGLGEEARQAFDLEVLRPPTFEQLARVLRAAQARGKPYHIVHFDGHGLYREGRTVQERFSPLTFAEEHGEKHGYLAFENPALEDNIDPVGGTALGKLLVETGVPVLVLNACRSAHAEAAEAPQAAGADVHTQVRAFGSLAQEVMDAGVAGVVAMRYNVYVVTAARFVADLYAALVGGQSLGEAVTLGRKQLAADPLRSIAFDPCPLQDWPVPVAYEAARIQLFPQPAEEAALHIRLEDGGAAPARGDLDPELDKLRPEAGFYGRDETLLALDRAFDRERVVLLHAFAGSGKTATAAEFGRWYALTGGVDGPVLFTSFEQYRPLARVLDQLGAVFGPALERAGVHWLALEEEARRTVALEVLAQTPVLWIWDNVEPVAGFPAGSESAWDKGEQRELADFLRAARGSKAKFLLTSRRDERGWLGELPARVELPPMPMQERVQLAQALALRQGRSLHEVEDWRPLLRFTGGNPLTITVVVGQALRDGLRRRSELGAFVRRLRAGEAAIEEAAAGAAGSEGRSWSLAASLSYGFEHAFDQEERAQLALLHLFQGFVNVQVLRVMGDPGNDWALSELKGFTDEKGIALLDRAAEVGLLTAHGGGYYTIHPALPWYFHELFGQAYPEAAGPEAGRGDQKAANRAFVEAMGALGDYYHDQYVDGNRDVIAALRAEEANLLQARELARRNGWWGPLLRAMQGLRQLYDHTGRRAEWARLVAEIVPDFIDPATDGPRPGREEGWSLVTGYRGLLAEEGRRWDEAERLQRARVAWARQRAAAALAALEQGLPPEALDGVERNSIRTLAGSLHELGQIQRGQGQSDCVAAYRESLELSERIGERAGAASCALNLGRAYTDLPALRDLAQAEGWYRRSLDLTDEGDRLGRSKCLSQLGLVAHERFKEARVAGQPEEELLRYLNEAVGYYRQALDLTPPDAVDDLAVAHNQLGNVYGDAGDLDRALPHYREAIRYEEVQGNLYGAAQTRFNVALGLAQGGRLPDALTYARAALRGYQSYGQGAAADTQKTQQLIAMIERDLQAGGRQG